MSQNDLEKVKQFMSAQPQPEAEVAPIQQPSIDPEVEKVKQFMSAQPQPEVPDMPQVQQPSMGQDFEKVKQFMSAPTQQAQQVVGPKQAKLSQYDPMIKAASARHGVPENLIKAVMWQESRGNANARSPVGAMGLMQLMPDTARGLGVDPRDPAQNIEGGVKYLKQMIDKYGIDDIDSILSAYNAGPGAVDKYKARGQKVPYQETANYREAIKADLGTMSNRLPINPFKASSNMEDETITPEEEEQSPVSISQHIDAALTSAMRTLPMRAAYTILRPDLAGQMTRIIERDYERLPEGTGVSKMVGNLIGEIPLYIAGSAAVKGVAKAAGFAGKALLPTISRGALTGLIVGGLSVPEEDTVENRLKNAALSGVMFGGLSAAGFGLKKAGVKILDAAQKKFVGQQVYGTDVMKSAIETMNPILDRYASIKEGIEKTPFLVNITKNGEKIVRGKTLEKYKLSALKRLHSGTTDLMRNSLESAGIDPSLFPKELPWYIKWGYNLLEKGNAYDVRYPGANVTETYRSLMDANTKSGYIKNEIIDLVNLKQLSKTIKDTKIGSDKLLKITEKTISDKAGNITWAGKGKQPIGADWEAAKSLRKFYDTVFKYEKSKGIKQDYIKGYVQRKFRGPLKGMSYKKGPKGLEKMPSAMQRKLPDELPEAYEALRETDMGKLINLRIKKAAKIIAFKEQGAGQKVMRNHLYFSLLGKNDIANEISSKAYASLGINSKNTVSSILAGDVIDYSAKDIKKIMRHIDIMDDSLAWKFGARLKSTMMESLVFMNPKTILLKQHAQPWLTYNAEGGSSLRGSLLRRKSHMKKILNERDVKQVLTSSSGVDITELQDMVGKKSLLSKIISSPAWLGKKVFTRRDAVNREIVFSDMYHRVTKHASNPEKLSKMISPMLPAEQVMVRQGLEESLHEGAKRAGLIMAGRHNYFYTPLDMPEILNNPLGRLIPFTTWGRNQLMRYVGDITADNYQQAAKRIAYPLAMLGIFAALTGHRISGAHPMKSIMGLGSVQPLPIVSQPAKEFAMGNYKGAAVSFASFLPPVKLGKLIKETKDNGIVEGFFNLDPIEGHPLAGD